MYPPVTSLFAADDRLAAVYQLKIHLVVISPHIYRQVLVRGDTTLAEMHHIFQVAMGWENLPLHSFKLWSKECGIPCAGGIYFLMLSSDGGSCSKRAVLHVKQLTG